MADTYSFGELYDYITKNGTIMPNTAAIRSGVEDGMKKIFGEGFSTDPYTINGRLIDALTKLFVDTCGVCAQNANSLNPSQAAGSMLDMVGAIWGIPRLEGETDADYRKRIIGSASRGSGFAESIANAIANVQGVQKVIVLDNGNEDPAILPRDEYGEAYAHSIAVDPHSVFISVLGGTSAGIISAIAKTKSAGCGFTHNPEYGVSTNGYYIPTLKNLKITVSVSGIAYSGDDIVADSKAAIQRLLADNSINATITKPMVVGALSSYGGNIIGNSVSFRVSDTSADLSQSYEDVERVVIPAYRYISVPDSLIEVSVA